VAARHRKPAPRNGRPRANKQLAVLERKLACATADILAAIIRLAALAAWPVAASFWGLHDMAARRAMQFRPGYRLAAVAAGLLISAWCVATSHCAPDLRKALEQTDRDTRLPLERIALEAGRSEAPQRASRIQAQSPCSTSGSLAASSRLPVARDAGKPETGVRI
jgi:hypothetical protein